MPMTREEAAAYQAKQEKILHFLAWHLSLREDRPQYYSMYSTELNELERRLSAYDKYHRTFQMQKIGDEYEPMLDLFRHSSKDFIQFLNQKIWPKTVHTTPPTDDGMVDVQLDGHVLFKLNTNTWQVMFYCAAYEFLKKTIEGAAPEIARKNAAEQEEEKKKEISQDERIPAGRTFGYENNPSLEQLKKTDAEIRENNFPERPIREEDVRHIERRLQEVHRHYFVLTQIEPPPVVILPFHFFTDRVLLALEKIQAFDISLLSQIKEYPFDWSPALKIIIEQIKEGAQTIHTLCQQLSEVECAPGRGGPEAQKKILELRFTLSSLQSAMHEQRVRLPKKTDENEPKIVTFLRKYSELLEECTRYFSECHSMLGKAYYYDETYADTFEVLWSEALLKEMQENAEKRKEAIESLGKEVDDVYKHYREKFKAAAEGQDQTQVLQDYLAAIEKYNLIEKTPSVLEEVQPELQQDASVTQPSQHVAQQPESQELSQQVNTRDALDLRDEEPVVSPSTSVEQPPSPVAQVSEPQELPQQVNTRDVLDLRDEEPVVPSSTSAEQPSNPVVQVSEPQELPQQVNTRNALEPVVQQHISSAPEPTTSVVGPQQQISSTQGQVAQQSQPVASSVVKGAQAQVAPQASANISPDALDDVIVAIRRDREHPQKWFTKLLSRIGLNLRQTKETFTKNFTNFLSQRYGKNSLTGEPISKTKLAEYLKRFQEAQQYLEQTRPSKEKADKIIQNALDYIKGDGSKKDSLLPGFKSNKKELIDFRSYYGFGKEEKRYHTVMQRFKLKP